MARHREFLIIGTGSYELEAKVRAYAMVRDFTLRFPRNALPFIIGIRERWYFSVDYNYEIVIVYQGGENAKA